MAQTFNNGESRASIRAKLNANAAQVNAHTAELAGKANISQVVNALSEGAWNPSTNTPALSATPLSTGKYYVVNVAGSSSIPTGTNVDYAVDDKILSNGTVWQHVPFPLATYAKKDDKNELSDKQKLITGVDLFTIVGYVKATNRAVVANPDFKCTPFIRLSSDMEIVAKQLRSVGDEFRQAMFYASNTDESYISGWIENDNENLTINSSGIPVGTNYIRLNSDALYSPTLVLNEIVSNKLLNDSNLSDKTDIENYRKLKAGIDLFTKVGYVHKTTGIVDANAGYKHTDYLSLELIDEIKIENLATAGAFRQATFFTMKDPSGIVSSYTDDNANTIVLTKGNRPVTAKYVKFNTEVGKTPVITLGKLNYKAAAPVNTLLGSAAWKYINTVSGYSTYYGQYWNGTAFVPDNNFNSQLYDVTALAGVGAIHVRGWFYGSVPIIVFFQDQSLTVHVADGAKSGTIVSDYYDFHENVPAGANIALVIQSRVGHPAPFMEMVEEAPEIEVKKGVYIIADSLGQMLGHATELMRHIKEISPEYDIYNFAIGGERTVEIGSRVGAFQMFLTPDNEYLTTSPINGRKYFELPATTAAVNIGFNPISNSWNPLKLRLLKQTTTLLDCAPDRVFVDGIECLLLKTSDVTELGNYIGSTYTLNRIEAAAAPHAVYVGSQIIPKNIPNVSEDDIFILNFSQNGGWGFGDIPTGNAEDVADLIAQYERVVNSLGTKKYIIMSSHYAEPVADLTISVTSRVAQEAALKKAFGAKYFNAREYFCSTAVQDALATPYWNSDTYPTDIPGEVHPTADDIVKMTAGGFAKMFWCNPNSEADILHFSRRAYSILYQRVFERMKALRYFE